MITLPGTRANEDGTVGIFSVLMLSSTTNPSSPVTCQAAYDAIAQTGGSLPKMLRATDVINLQSLLEFGRQMWLHPLDPAVYLPDGYTPSTSNASGPALVLSTPNGPALVQNVPCSTEGIVVRQADVPAGTALPDTAVVFAGKLLCYCRL